MATQHVPLTSDSVLGNTDRPVHEPSSFALSRFAGRLPCVEGVPRTKKDTRVHSIVA